MGQTTSKPGEFVIPMKKNFKLSYLIYEQINEIPEIKEEIDLRILVENYSGLLEGFIFHKCKQIGYTLVSPKLNVISIRIDTILNDIKHKGIHVSNTSFNDFILDKKCYKPTLNTIYHFLNNGKILLAGIILTDAFTQETLKMHLHECNDIISDIILIVGYNQEHIYIKTEWCKNVLQIKNTFIDNIKEVWDVDIKPKY
jgi:hypothetical protein